MTFNVKTNDYFSTADMKAEGEARWSQLRAEVKRQGFRVGQTFGLFGYALKENHYIVLHPDGDLVHTATVPRGRLLSIAEVIGAVPKPIKREKVKIRTTTNKIKIKLAFDHLVGLGYSDINRAAIIEGDNRRIVGIVGDENGVIYSIVTEKTFSTTYANVAEILCDVETTHVLTNIRRKKKLVEINGVTVEEDALNDWLKAQSAKSTA